MTADRLRLGFFSYVSGPGQPGAVYQDVIDLFVRAERIGVDSVWVAQHHFGNHGGLPSPLMFLAAVAERTHRIGLGTAVITLPFENALRVAEDAAVFETLYPGRLQLGFGTGFGAPVLGELFNVDLSRRREVYTAALGRIRAALAGDPVDDEGSVLVPKAPALLDRIWEGPSQTVGVAEAAHRGSGLLLSRAAIGTGATPTPVVQVPFVDRHEQIVTTGGGTPRVMLSRTIYPAASRAAAADALRPGFEPLIAHTIAATPELADLTFAEHLAFANVHYGDPDDIVASLEREPILPRATDLVFQVQPANPGHAETLAIIETVVRDIAPRLLRRGSS